jgi:2-methylcitrate dehydratase PrpD
MNQKREITKELAYFLHGIKYEDLPQKVVESAKFSILDSLGCQAGLSKMPWSQQIYKTIQEMGGVAESTIIYYGYKTNAENAAFVNSAFNHGHEIDDTYLGIPTHPRAAIIPAAVALGEKERITGRDLILAVVVGHEASLRIGLGVARSLIKRGHHPPVAIGPFGAAALAAKIYNFTADEFHNVLGVAGSFAGGLLEYTQAGGSVKRVHCGIPAQGGLRAAHLARNGITGPPTVVEGNKGFCKVFAGEYNFDRILQDMGKEWTILDVSTKIYDCCHYVHAHIDATKTLLEENSIDPDSIETVVAKTSEQGKVHMGVIVEPPDILGAQFSIPFSLAMTIIKGSNGFGDYTEADLKDPRLLDLSRRVKLEVDDEMERLHPAVFGGVVELHLKDGKRYSNKVIYQKGHPKNPLSSEEYKNKFRLVTKLALPEDQTEKALSLVESLEDLDDVSKILPPLIKK